MTKRKRKAHRDEKATKEGGRPSVDKKTRSDDTLEHVLCVSSLTGTSRSDPDSEQKASLQFLLGSMMEGRNLQSPSMSMESIALILVPWSVKQLVTNTYTKSTVPGLLWKNLYGCLNLLLQSNDVHSRFILTTQMLTKNTLNKICPKIARYATQHGNQSENSDFAAQSYRLLIDFLFLPTIDVAFNSLLRSITSQRLEPSESVDTILHSTLNLVEKLLMDRRGNPKTTFQLISSLPSLLSLSKVYVYFETRGKEGGCASVCRIISIGLFHRNHHLEGFYSMLQKSRATIDDTRNDARNDGKGNTASAGITAGFRSYQQHLLEEIDKILNPKHRLKYELEDILHIARIIPVLLRCFLGEKFEQKIDKRGQKPSEAQFQLFVRFTVALQRSLENAVVDLQENLLQSIHSMLKTILENDTYTPSQAGAGDYHFDFLSAILQQILQFSCRKEDYPKGCISVLGGLLRLNHKILHGDLDSVLLFALEAGGESRAMEVGDFFALVVTTYGKLRQQGYAFKSLLKLLDRLKDSKREIEAMLLLKVLQLPNVRFAAKNCCTSCPIVATKEIFDCFDTWLEGVSSRLEHNRKIDETLLQALSELIAILAVSLRVDKASAATISQVCDTFVGKGLSKLALSTSELSITSVPVNVSATICAWILDLHSRCSFWHGMSEHLLIPSGLLSRLPELGKVHEAVEPGKLHGVVFLSCHRIRLNDVQLQEEIHRQIESGGSLEEDEVLINEVNELTQHIFNAAHACPALWSVIERQYKFWLKYSKPEQVRVLVKWACSTADPANDHLMLCLDPEFRGHKLVRSCLRSTAIHVAYDKAKEELDKQKTHSVVSHLDKAGAEEDILSLLEKCFANQLAFPPGSILSITAAKDELQHSCFLINQIAVQSQVPAKGMQDLSTLVKLALLFRLVATDNPGEDFMRWQNTLISISCMVCQHVSPQLPALLKKQESTEKIANILFGSYKVFSAANKKVMTNTNEASFSFGIEQIVETVSRSCLENDTLSAIDLSVVKAKKEVKSNEDFRCFVAFMRFILKGATGSIKAGTDEGHIPNAIIKCIWNSVSEVSRQLDGVGDKSFERVMLAADILRFSSESTQNGVSRAGVDGLEMLKGGQAISDFAFEACSYAIGTLVLRKLPVPRDEMIEIIVKEKRESPLLDAAFIRLCESLNPTDFVTVLRRMTRMKTSDTPLRLILYCLQFVTNEQAQDASQLAPEIFRSVCKQFISLDNQGTGETGRIDVALQILEYLVRTRSLFAFREVDLALVLSKMCLAMGPKKEGGLHGVPLSTFTNCNTLMASMMQRYTKLLFACVPGVVSVLYRLQHYAMFAGNEGKIACQLFCGICEMIVPHKEVYKKHLVGVLHEAIDGWATISAERRHQYLPCLYSFLDAMSTYEVQQLNAMLDMERKVLFRRVYQGHQKGHVYKGQ